MSQTDVERGLSFAMSTTSRAAHIAAQSPKHNSNPRALAALISTGLFAALMTVSGVLYLVGPPPIVAAIAELGYPPYFRVLLGVAKLMGVAGLLLPRRPTLREWAYAGFTFDLVAALVSHAVVGGAAHAPPAAFALALLAASYFLRRGATTVAPHEARS
jgi:hypothetical protein